MKKAYLMLFAFLLFFVFSLKAQTSGTLTFTFSTTAPTTGYASKHFIAVWIQDNTGTFVKTKTRLGSSGNCNSHLLFWKSKSASNVVDAVTGSTVTSYTTVHTITWNGTNVSNALVADGNYRVYVESSWNDANVIGIDRDTISVGFVKGTSTVNLTPANTTHFTGMSLSWAPAASATLATSAITGSPFCAGSPVSVPFSLTGTYNTGNVFTAQLSDASGSFTSPTTIGTLTGTTAGTISATIPTSALAGTAYRIRVKASNPSTTAADNGTNLTINTAVTPSVSITTPSTTVCLGANVTFTAAAVNGGTPSYAWKINGNAVGSNAGSFSISSLANNDTVYCVMTSTANCPTTPVVTSNKIKMTIQSSLVPSVQISVNNQNICAGDTAFFSANSTNGGTPTYQWKVNNINSSTNSSFTSTALNNHDTVSCIMTSSLGCITTPTATSNKIGMTVNPVVVPSVSINASSALNICPNENIQFTAVPTNGGTPTYQWKMNGINVGTASTFSHSFNMSSKVEVYMTSSTVCAKPNVTSTFDSIKVFDVASAIITANANSLQSSATAGNQWYNVISGLVTGANSQTFTPTQSGYYYTIVTDINGCKDTSNTLFYSGVYIENNSFGKKLSVFPNPSTGMIYISCESEFTDVQVSIQNTIGQILLEKPFTKLSGNNNSIDLNNLEDGVYFIKIKSGRFELNNKIVLKR